MKGVSRARDASRGLRREGGRSAAAPSSCVRHLPDAERGWCRAVFAAAAVKIVHSSSKSGDNGR